MSSIISITNNFPNVIRKLNTLPDTISAKVMVRAMNASIVQGKTQMARQISKEFRITVTDAKDRLAVSKASAKAGAYKVEASLEATRKGKGRAMNLMSFVTTVPTRNKKGKLPQVKFQVKRGGGRKTITGAFIGNKGRTLFKRVGDARLPIESLKTIDIPQMFNTKRINEVVRQSIIDRFKDNAERELSSALRGFLK